MGIRKAVLKDAAGIGNLLDQLEYPGTKTFLAKNIGRLIDHPDEALLVFEEEDKILGFISLHFIPQIALEGDFARISYFSVDESARSKGIGRAMEEHCAALARERGCDRMEVHCHTRRTAAHNFYFRQGYEESPKYLMKKFK
ncbi:MAG: GNAT family N-acetyltransferase [Puia sp.]|nr:GNAT family N-acetyltransferase [Puia sp.]